MVKHFSAVIALLCVLAGCSTNPVTGKNEFSLVSAQGEVAIGQQHYLPSQQQQGGRYVVDPELTLYVKEVGMSLAAVSDRPGLPYDFVVLNNDQPNAWALPGGKIAINRGLLIHLDDEAQLAAVLAHEVVHAAARHGALRQTQQQVLGLGAIAVGVAASVSDNEYGSYLGMAAMGGSALYQAHYSRQNELDSDSYGIDYMVRAGYDPQAAVELQKTFVELSKGHKADVFSRMFASHPPSATRVERNKQKAAVLGGGKRNRARFQRAIAQIKRDMPAYALQQEAIKDASEKNFISAHKKLRSAINLQPDEALFYVTQGQLNLSESKYTAAEKSFSQANSRNPDYFMGVLGLGLAQKAQSKFSTAKQNLQKSLRILTTPVAQYHLGEIAENEGQRETAAKYYYQVAQSGSNLSTEANKKLEVLGYASQTNATTPSTR